ncbi:MAG: hypothetical protein JXR83_10470 [Deltaproteobacteria bacterium]|nr:hypothetical protein [Deltaproteobacteria bacterium]
MNKFVTGVAAMVLLGAGNCGGNNNFTRPDSGGVPSGITWQDIGTACTYDPLSGNNPTNTCGRTGLVCVIATSDGAIGGYGTFMYEAIPLYTRFLATEDEGICTLVSAPGMPPPACPAGTYAVMLSSGHHICMRGCDTSEDCGRDGYVCDYRLMNGSTYNSSTGAVQPLAVRMCVPACLSDVPYCLRTFIDPDYVGQDGSRLLYVYDGDLFGARECDPVTGLCYDVTTRGAKYVGDRCTHTSECAAPNICISGLLYGAPEEHGFCARYCDPSGQSQQLTCEYGQGCEYFLGVGYCFPNCNNNLCAGEGQQCQYADPNKAGIGPGQEWRDKHCIQCELSNLICSSPDAGVGADAARDGGSSG